MAFSNGQQSVEAGEIKRYKGVGSSYVLAVNPNKEQLEKIYGRTIENEPQYTSMTEGEKPVKQVRIEFIVKADPEKYEGVNLVTKVVFFLRQEFRVGANSGKYQIIDKYGRTAWATPEEVEANAIPQYASGPASINSNYRRTYVGEEDLVNFLISYLNIPAPQKFVDGKWVMKSESELKDSEALLEKIPDYFNGNVTELKNIVNLQPNNKVKLAYGIRHDDSGKLYQTVFTRMFLRNGARDYTKLHNAIKDAQSNGAFANSEFDCYELHEYKVESTDLSKEQPAETPFGTYDLPW